MSANIPSQRSRFLNAGVVVTLVMSLILTGIAVYFGTSANVNNIFLGYPAWISPLIYWVVLVIFTGDKIRRPVYVAINVAICIAAGVLLIFPPPGAIAEQIKWFYLLGAALVITIFTDF